MKNSILVPLLLVVALFCYLSYHIGRRNGFDQGWDKGYIRGTYDSECIDDDQVTEGE